MKKAFWDAEVNYDIRETLFFIFTGDINLFVGSGLDMFKLSFANGVVQVSVNGKGVAIEEFYETIGGVYTKLAFLQIAYRSNGAPSAKEKE